MDRGFVLWFTGVTLHNMKEIARLIETRLLEVGANVELLDAESMKEKLFNNFSGEQVDSDAAARFAAFTAQLLSRNGVISIVACHAPAREIMDQARQEVDDFIEVYLKSQKESSFEGKFEAPHKAEVEINIDVAGIEEACNQVLKTLEVLDLVPSLTGGEYSENEEEEVKRRLQDLGYI